MWITQGLFETCDKSGRCPHCEHFDVRGGCAKEREWIEPIDLHFLELARRGHFPVAGGMVDQSYGFLVALEIYRAEVEKCWALREEERRLAAERMNGKAAR